MDIMKKVAPKLSVVIPCTAVILLAGAQSAAAAGCPVTQAAVVSNAGAQSAKGTLSQAFCPTCLRASFWPSSVSF
jgi:hypothetical protein